MPSARKNSRTVLTIVAAFVVGTTACGNDGDRQSPEQLYRAARQRLNPATEMTDKATLDLDHFGPWTTEIKIEVPPFRGIEPRLSLNYSSSGSNGFVGHGWNVGLLFTGGHPVGADRLLRG